MAHKVLVEISERVRIHLIKQKKQSLDERSLCMYRGKDGLKCAIGVLIKDEYYDESFENNTLHSTGSLLKPAVLASLAESGLTVEEDQQRFLFAMLDKWQSYHDLEYGLWLGGDKSEPSPDDIHWLVLKDYCG